MTAFTAWTAWGGEGEIIPTSLMLVAVPARSARWCLTTGRQDEGWTFVVSR